MDKLFFLLADFFIYGLTDCNPVEQRRGAEREPCGNPQACASYTRRWRAGSADCHDSVQAAFALSLSSGGGVGLYKSRVLPLVT